MAEFTVRLGTPAGEIVTRTVEALAALNRRRAAAVAEMRRQELELAEGAAEPRR